MPVGKMLTMPYPLPGKSYATQGTSKDHSGHGSPQCRHVALSGTWLLAAHGSGCSGQHSTPEGRRRSRIQQLDQEHCVIGISLRAYGSGARCSFNTAVATMACNDRHAASMHKRHCCSYSRNTYGRDSIPEHKICWASQAKFLQPCVELPREPSITCQYELRLIPRYM